MNHRTNLQRKCACGGAPGPTGECEECRKKRLQRKAQKPAPATRSDSSVPPIVGQVLHSPGQPLDTTTRSFMEHRFGHNFAGVRIHSDDSATESARAVSADAYTFGHHIVFGAGQYDPDTKMGRRLIAHELTHVLQQSMTHQVSDGSLTGRCSDAEHEATEIADTIDGSQSRAVSVKTGPMLARQIIRENPYHPSPKVPDLDEDVVKRAEQAVAARKFQLAIDTLLQDASAINRVNLGMLEGGTMHFDSQLNQEGHTDDPKLDRSGQPLPSRVTIGPLAFASGISWLYSTLLHEFTHVQQDQPTSSHMPVQVKGVSGDPGSTYAKEVEAYAFEITHAGATGLKASPNLITELWGRLCHAFLYLMPIRRRSMESLARTAFQAAERIVGKNKLTDCVGNP